jgi:hypothetical protein
MTKEELKQEAEKSLDKRLGTYAYIRKQDCYTNYVDGYIDGAEPREKRIAELKKACDETQELLNKQIEATLKLDKENAELKVEWQEQVQKATDEGYARTLQTIQLSKAKEIIKAFLDSSDLNIKHKAEEFLGEF